MPNLVGIGNSQVPTNAMLGGLAYQDSVGEINLEKIKGRINYDAQSSGGNGLYAQFGTAGNGSVITSNYYARGSMRYDRMGSSGNSGEFDLLSSAGYFQLCGTLSSPANAGFRGYMDIIDPQSAMVTIVGKGIMHNSSGNNAEKYLESFACSADDGERSGLTDFRLNMGNINSNGSDLTSTTAVSVYGRVSIFGVNQWAH